MIKSNTQCTVHSGHMYGVITGLVIYVTTLTFFSLHPEQCNDWLDEVSDENIIFQNANLITRQTLFVEVKLCETC